MGIDFKEIVLNNYGGMRLKANVDEDPKDIIAAVLFEKLKVDVAADFEQQIKETFEETDNNIKQAKETQSEIEKLLKELDE